MGTYPPTQRTQVKRIPERGDYSRATIHGILDSGFLCHVGFIAEGKPVVIPTGYGRSGEILYIHGSAASRMLRTLADGVEVCLTVILLDGLVLARSAFHHSMNYRSVVVFGVAHLVESREEKLAALRVISEQIVPGRWSDVRQPSEQELKATKVLALRLAEASAKVRTGAPVDEEEDYGLPVWAGVLPLSLQPGTPVADPRLEPGVEAPPYVRNYESGRNSSEP